MSPEERYQMHESEGACDHDPAEKTGRSCYLCTLAAIRSAETDDGQEWLEDRLREARPELKELRGHRLRERLRSEITKEGGAN